MANLFEIATRAKYRFPYKGQISVEDLWDLTPAQLDTIYKTLNKNMKAQGEDSLLTEATVDTTLTNMVEIVKHIFTVKRNEAEARKAAVENAEKKRRIMDALAKKQDEALNAASEEDLKKMLADLG
jgi:hypothetical protein